MTHELRVWFDRELENFELWCVDCPHKIHIGYQVYAWQFNQREEEHQREQGVRP